MEKLIGYIEELFAILFMVAVLAVSFIAACIILMVCMWPLTLTVATLYLMFN